jgi:hypothetical protein
MRALQNTLNLPALDGANPLGFLAALGALTILSETDSTIKLGWQCRARWVPFIVSSNPLNEADVLQRLTTRLRGKPVDAENQRLREEAQKRFDSAKRNLKSAEDRLKKLSLKGKARDEARSTEVEPCKQALRIAYSERQTTLKNAVPSPELALGQRPDCTVEEFRESARLIRRESSPNARATVDLLASFGSEASEVDADRIAPTLFCFITGSGHQWFLETARELMAVASESKLREALFEPWVYTDEKLTMRWDPLDDRRYALMDRDPTASYNKSTTVWMANLLAYFALSNFPCAMTERGPANTGWSRSKDSIHFAWPVWCHPLSRDAIRSLLCYQAVVAVSGGDERAESRLQLRARGIEAVFAARRIQVGNPPLHKINFSPSVAQ